MKRALLIALALAAAPLWATAQAAAQQPTEQPTEQPKQMTTAPAPQPTAHQASMAAALLKAAGRFAPAGPANDPLEGINRAVFLFNGVLDHVLIKPVAEAYESMVPKPLRAGVGNALGNVSDAWSAVNLVLQGKGARAVEMTLRVGINTTFGLAGLLDIATEAGLERQTEDFGQTLGRWGVPAGPYVVLPLFGPSTLRDAAAFSLDTAYTSAVFPSDAPQKWRWLGLRLTDARTDALPFTRMLDTVALDKYIFVRDAYLSRRRNLVYDGNPPPLEQDDATTALERDD